MISAGETKKGCSGEILKYADDPLGAAVIVAVASITMASPGM